MDNLNTSAEDTLSKALITVFEECSDLPCLTSTDGASWTYGQLNNLSKRITSVLLSFGLGQGSRVLVQVQKSTEAVAFYLACLRLGCVFIPLNTDYTDQEISYFIEDAKPDFVLCDPEREEQIKRMVETEILTLGPDMEGTLMVEVEASDPTNICGQVKPGDVAAILYTSGTTGRSKGAMISQENLLTNARALIRIWGWSNRDVLLHALPIFHVHGLFVALHCVFLSRASAIFLQRFVPEQVLRSLPLCTVMMGVPTFYTRLLKFNNLGAACSKKMRLFISGSAPLREQTFIDWEAITGFKILERYGMTETGMITSNPLDGERVAGTVGFPLPEVEVRIANNSERIEDEGEIGMIEVRGPNVFLGYWRMPEKTAAEFSQDGYFKTGDLGFLESNDRLTIVGRGKDMIISGGYNIYPKEIEVLVDEIDGISESAIIGVPHPDFGEGVLAVVVPESFEIKLEVLVSALEHRLARFKMPKAVINLKELPRNTMGKVQKNELKRRFSDLFEEY